MRRLILVLMLLATTLHLSSPASAAATMTAEQFATDCNADGDVDVVKSLTVLGGSANLTTHCLVYVPDKSSLKFEDVLLTGASNFTVDGGAGAKVTLKDALFSMVGYVNLEPGNGIIAQTPKAKLTITDSSITSTTGLIYLGASASFSGGKVTIKNSQIDAGGGAGDTVFIYASYADPLPIDYPDPSKGSVKITGGSLNAAGDWLDIRTFNGKTSLAGVVTTAANRYITAGPEGKCTLKDNTPTLVCSV